MFGLDNNVGKPAVEAAVKELDPLLRDVENRLGGILHGLLDRFEIDIHIKLNPVPKATPVDESLG